VHQREFEYPACEVAGGGSVYRFGEVGAFCDSPKGDAAPEEKIGCRDERHSAKEREKAEGIGEKRLKELEPDCVSEACGEPATRTRQVCHQQESAWGQPKLSVGSIAAC
jgi:hypothetical protein